MYTAPAKSVRRRAAQTALYRIADALVRALAPLMCFTAEEVWAYLHGGAGAGGSRTSVHASEFIPASNLREGITPAHAERLTNWPRLIAVRNEVLKALEVMRKEKFIGTPLEAKVVLAADGDVAGLLHEYRALLPTLFIVSQVEISPSPLLGARETEVAGLQVQIVKAAGKKCARCWNYSERVGDDARYPGLRALQ